MIDTVVLATSNEGKFKELQKILEDAVSDLISLKDLDSPPEVIEDGQTFRDNALKKAHAICLFSGIPTLADDSGIVVDALGGGPGVYSARYAGENATDKDNINKLLTELGDNPNREARFVCCLALVFPNGEEIVVDGKCEGVITKVPKGEGGFGYDPVFFVPGHEMTMAEIAPETKNTISHRANAARSLLKALQNR